MYERHGEPQLNAPVLIIGLDGWIDAGFGGVNAIAALRQSIDTEPIVTFDSDAFIDYRSRRPTLHIENGINTGLTWPQIEMRAGTDAANNDVVMLVGPEPDQQWRAFTNIVCDLAIELGARIAVSLRAWPAPVPHTRPVRLAATATTPELAAQIGFVPGQLQVAAGIQAALERALHERGIPAVGIWARVPIYVAQAAYPAASIALLEALQRLTGVTSKLDELQAAARVTRDNIDQLIAQSAEHASMVAGLEQQADAEVQQQAAALSLEDLPTGDEIAAELERFLRGETGPTA